MPARVKSGPELTGRYHTKGRYMSVSKSTIWPQASYVRGAGAEGERSALSGDAKEPYRRGVCVCMSLRFDRRSNFYRIKWNSVQQCASGLAWKDWAHPLSSVEWGGLLPLPPSPWIRQCMVPAVSEDGGTYYDLSVQRATWLIRRAVH